MSCALSDIRVVELAEGWRGPLAGRLLLQLGADVVKVETGHGDWLRGAWPHNEEGHGHAFELTSAGKRSVRIEHRADAEQAKQLLKLMEAADVVLMDEAWLYQAASLVGSVESLMQRLPHVVFCSVTPFGREGTWRDNAASDLTLQSLGGLMASTGFPDDPPTRAGPTFADHATALYAAAATIAALVERRRSGLGQLIDLSSHDCLLSYLFLFLSPYFLDGTVPPRQGNRHLTCAPWNAYRCADGWVQISTSSDLQWAMIARLSGKAELAEDTRFSSTAARMARIDAVDEVVSEWIRPYSLADVLPALNAASVPAAPICTVADLLDDPQFRARDMLVDVPAAAGHTVPTSGSIFKLSSSSVQIAHAAPALGAHTREVLNAWTPRPTLGVGGDRSSRPLHGVMVLDIGGYGAGPFGARLLAELGAEVIKVEPPGGDPVRNFMPHLRGVSYPYHFYNLNKRGVTLDLKTDEGREELLRLIDRCDVLIENLAPRTMEKWGLGYEVLRLRHPRLIYCSVSGFGRAGPNRDRLAYDTTIQALSGVMSITGRAEHGPTKVGVSIADLMGPTAACGAILAALYQRAATGQGQLVDLAMMERHGVEYAVVLAGLLATGEVPHQQGDTHPALCPHGSFATADGRVVVAIERDAQWQALAALCGERARAFAAFSTAERVSRRQEIEACVSNWARLIATDECVRQCQALGIPAAPVLEIDEVVETPHVRSRRLLVDVGDGHGLPMRVIESAFRMSRTPGRMLSGGPDLGEHNDVYVGATADDRS